MADLPEGVRELDHTADVGIELEAPDAATLFDRAARALRALAVPDAKPADGSGEGRSPADGSPRAGDPEGEGDAATHAVDLVAGDPAVLLVRWLNELLYRIDALGLAYEAAELEVGERRLHARIRETRLPEPGAQVKAITYHGLECGPRSDGRWGARVIFDV